MGRRHWLGVMAMALVGSSTATAPAEPDGGIGVRGDWTLDVHDADGTLARHVEFTNHLVDAEAVPKLFTRERIGTAWGVRVLAASGNLCVGGPCEIREGEQAGSPLFGDLAVTPQPHGLRLSGTFTSIAGTIDMVQTVLYNCHFGAYHADTGVCSIPYTTTITQATGLSVPLMSNQYVVVTVDITFSTAS